jgi:type IV fimbrial biogenesis protein FimT
MGRANRQAGVTFFELLVTLCVVLVLVSMAVPPMQRLIDYQQLASWQYRLHTALNLTRNHAVYHAVPTVICARDGDACAEEGGHWSNGWIIFEDPGALNHCRLGPESRRCDEGGGRVLRVVDGPDYVRVINNHNIARRVRFDVMGLSYGYTGRFGFCVPDSERLTRGLVVPNTGRIRSARENETLPC